MKWLSAGLTFVNLSVVCGLLLGMVGHGLNVLSAALALVCGAAFAVAAWLGTSDPDKPGGPKAQSSKATVRYRKFWFWVVAAFFALFAVRSFCWLLYIDGGEWKIQSPNNLGDLSLHITLIRNFANGVHLWPDSPIYALSKLRYPAGIDLFNALLCLVHVDLMRGLVWTGLLGSLATFYAFFRWGGTFGVAGFLFNGGIAGFQFLKTLKFLDYQGGNKIAWKSIPLSMFVTQRGWLYAIPAALVLLWHWREKYFRETPIVPTGRDLSAPDAASAEAAAKTGAKEDDSEARPPVAADDVGQATAVNARSNSRGPLPFWVELSLYASMPLFHVHTFIALTIVLVIALFFERLTWPKIFSEAPMRRHATKLLGAALIPATFFVWLVTDQFHAKSMVKWHPGWVQDSADFGAPFFRMGGAANFGSATAFGSLLQKTWNGVIAPFFQFWLTNFGLWVLLALALVGLCGWRAWKAGWRWGTKPPADVAFVLPAVVIFAIGYFVQTAPWDWDNLKLMVWGYFLILPFLWSDLIGRWAFPERAVTCVALFASGFITLLGGLAAGHPGFGLMDRARLDAIGTAVRPLPVEARFAAYPTYNHPLLLQGRKVVLGYPGHLWTEGFDYDKPNRELASLMRGAPNWREAAQALGVRYIFWGRDETANYQGSTRPWETTARRTASGDWGAIYDLSPESP
ncbi:MAG: hypothetical protein AUI00_03320 [Verrucomicrobia bacterium 13_2_20CM_2_54_15]|nr:MAG: hypothetical protein AUI00_03320 [Verrucomicrobia bacterium 13_2_20CM_2_54_15]